MISFPNAKINLGLSVTSKRSDGFHNLTSIFYPINWCDILEILPAKETSFSSSGIKIPGVPENNLCLKAYELLREEFSISPVAIHLKKNIPIGAGLGGGSADAAFTLKMLNNIFDLNLSPHQLEDRAKLLGSDCSFFIKNKPVIATEKGNIFENTKLNLTDYYILLVNPGIHISTQGAYNSISPKERTTDYSTIDSVVGTQLINDFEESVLSKHKKLKEIKEELQKEAIYTSMTGSGSTIFGIFEKKSTADNLKEFYKNYSTHIELIS